MRKYLPHFSLLLTIIVWGSSFPVMSFLLVSIDAMPLALSRFFLPGFLSFLIIIFLKIKIKLKDIFKFILAGLIGIFFYNFF